MDTHYDMNIEEHIAMEICNRIISPWRFVNAWSLSEFCHDGLIPNS